MSDRATVLIVDDDEIMRMLLENALAPDYQVLTVTDGASCIAACGEWRPDLVLLDVEMPGIDGYETCRRLKAAASASPPVVFISSHDRVEDRLRGYDAGGEDYIRKPIELEELRTKVALRLKAVAERSRLEQAIDYASRTAMTAMSALGETGHLLQSLQRFNNCAGLDELAQLLVTTLSDYSLSGMVRLRATQEVVMRSTQGAVSPIEESIIELVAGMGRIVEYRSRMSISYDHIVLVVTNAPLDDDERRGRIRDHLAVLAQAAEMSMVAINRGMVIERALRETSQALLCIQDAEREMQVMATLAMQNMTDQLERAFLSAGLSDSQEHHIADIVEKGVKGVRQAMQAGEDVLPLLSAAIGGLNADVGINAAKTTIDVFAVAS
jgi:DNA-binding response OmpR family regulator